MDKNELTKLVIDNNIHELTTLGTFNEHAVTFDDNLLLRTACEHSDVMTIKTLVSLGANLHTHNNICIVLAGYRHNATVFAWLLGGSFNKSTRLPEVLANALVTSNLDVISVLLNSNHISIKTVTCVIADTMANIPAHVVEFLIKDLKVCVSADHGSMFYAAAKAGNLSVITVMIELGIDLTIYGPKAITAAGMGGDLSVIEYLISIEAPMDISIEGYVGYVDLASNGCYEAVTALSSYLDNLTKHGVDAVNAAVENNHQDIVKWLLTNSVSITDVAESAITSCVANKHYEMVMLLMKELTSVTTDQQDSV